MSMETIKTECQAELNLVEDAKPSFPFFKKIGYDSYTIQIIILKCTIQRILVYTQDLETITTI